MTDYDFDIQTIKSKFFTPHHIQQYTASLGDYLTSRRWTLLSLEQLRNFLLGSGTDTYRRMVDAFKDQFATKICGLLNPRHITVLINKLLLSYNLYLDMLVLADNDYIEYLGEPIETRLQHLHGFLIVQKGGYEPEPRTYIAKLVCTRGFRGAGTILVGAYLATIHQHSATEVTQLARLELFRGYENLAGLCAYTKFGFVPDLSYRHSRFSDSTVELPMIVDVSSISWEEIVGAAKGRRHIVRLNAERMRTDSIYAALVYTPLCRRGVFAKVEGDGTEEQANLATLYNRLYVAVYRKNERKIAELMEEIRAMVDTLRASSRRGQSRRRSTSTASATSRKSRTGLGSLRKTKSAGSMREVG